MLTVLLMGGRVWMKTEMHVHLSRSPPSRCLERSKVVVKQLQGLTNRMLATSLTGTDAYTFTTLISSFPTT